MLLSRHAPLALLLGALLTPALAQEKPPAQPPAPAPTSTPTPAPAPASAQPAAPATPASTKASESPDPALTSLAHIETRGTGPIPVILIPALVCDWTLYDDFMTRNAERYTMYAITLPGFGKSAPPPTPTDDVPSSAAPWLENATRDILKLADDRKLDKPIILGVSTGGHIALRAALAAPDKFRAVVTLNGLPAMPLHGTTILPQASRDRIVHDEIANYWKTSTDEAWLRDQEDWIKASFPDPKRAESMIAQAADIPKATSGRYMVEYFASDLSERLPGFKLPILAICSLPKPTDQQFAPLRESWRAAFARLPQAKLAYFEVSGELITEDSPAELDRALDQFLKGQEIQGKAWSPDKPLPPRPSNVQPLPPPADPKPPEPKPTDPKPEPK